MKKLLALVLLGGLVAFNADAQTQKPMKADTVKKAMYHKDHSMMKKTTVKTKKTVTKKVQ